MGISDSGSLTQIRRVLECVCVCVACAYVSVYLSLCVLSPEGVELRSDATVIFKSGQHPTLAVAICGSS